MNSSRQNLVNQDESVDSVDSENVQPAPIPYPKRVFFIIGNEFCERFNYFGMKAILVLYITEKLNKDDNFATVQFHAFSMLVYFANVFGGILCDNWLGKFKTIIYLSMVYCIGSVVMAVGAVPHINVSAENLMYIGLFLIAFGSGGIKPCVSAFAGDQFKLPEQAIYLAQFFSMFYVSINAGSFISITVTPVLRAKVHCFGDNDCYSLAFGLPALLMVIAIGLFLFGKKWYTINSPCGMSMLQVIKCIMNGIITKRRESATNPREHYLDYSVKKFGQQLVNDTKSLLNLIVLFLPLSMFWALNDQQGSRWVIQANNMNGDLGFYTILPDQMQSSGPILLLLFAPLFDYCFYPLLGKIGLHRPLQKISMSGFLAAIAILLSAFVEWKIQVEPKKSLCILWQIPQIAVMNMAEVMFYVTGLAFAYEQAPKDMKSMVQSFWLLTIGLGNAIIVIVTELNMFTSQVNEFIFFACSMVVAIIIFIILAHKYKPITTLKE
ncbi:peptide transporter family 1-like [Contarinia nasturtii]|uniref:peptide transporter family 1-like n=1 Tax=Contarinia nasturtii TaxID=265458 RepID=UPI0012D3D6D2|nr:peptide transporter family 1-like [Contarinia nasturtii]